MAKTASMYYTETRKRGIAPEYDRMLVWATVLLLALGMVMVYSASIAIAEGGRSTAFHAARPGEAVLLSPACASYDMFRSYVHRGEVFVDAVRALALREEGSR